MRSATASSPAKPAIHNAPARTTVQAIQRAVQCCANNTNLDSPKSFRTGLSIRGFPGSLQDRNVGLGTPPWIAFGPAVLRDYMLIVAGVAI